MTSPSQSGSTTRSWQKESGDLRSGNNVAAPQEKKPDPEGNLTAATVCRPDGVTRCDPDILNGVLPRACDSNANDNSESASRDIEGMHGLDESRSGRKSFTSFLPPPPPPPPQETDYLSHDQVCDEDVSSPPPLPPKLGSPVSNQQYLCENRTKQGEPTAESSLDNTLPKLPHSPSPSEESIPGVVVQQPRTPSRYEAMERHLIKSGFYSVPSKPPIPDPPTPNPHHEGLDAIEQALDDLQRTASSLARNSLENYESGSSMETNSVDVSNHFLRKEALFSIPDKVTTNNLPPPTPPNSDDHYFSPIFKSGDDFAVELEASFERIRNGMPSYAPEQSSVESRNHLSSLTKSYSGSKSKGPQSDVRLSGRKNVQV